MTKIDKEKQILVYIRYSVVMCEYVCVCALPPPGPGPIVKVESKLNKKKTSDTQAYAIIVIGR